MRLLLSYEESRMCRSADYTPASKRRKGEFIKFPVEKSQKRTSGENLTVAPTERANPQGPGAIEQGPPEINPRTRLSAKLRGHENLRSSNHFPGSVPGDSGRRKWNKSLQYGL
jgi:hypothetical protein